jgi:hypothetical protein
MQQLSDASDVTCAKGKVHVVSGLVEIWAPTSAWRSTFDVRLQDKTGGRQASGHASTSCGQHQMVEGPRQQMLESEHGK